MNGADDVTARRRHAEAWKSLAAAIAADRVRRDEPANPPAERGELTIIGSGIETAGFALGDEDVLRGADHVFYCVADPGTARWIRSIRPDAYDLYVLYDDGKTRYATYMQMSEAMLHFVRRGRRVVAVYYGHPGIFVLSTHRCIAIARREGHLASMRPAVSALDCLCADLGVDPCHPGMQTHEATDMLIRGRKPDPSLHVVLWQVGLIGEMGFRRAGYLNANLPVLVDYLISCYGEAHSLVHYVASRYPTIPPVIEHYTLAAVRNPRLHPRFTGISTWYLPPRDPVQGVPEMLVRLGLARPGQTLRHDRSPLRDIGSYGLREQKAIRAFRGFRIPPGYHFHADTGAARFIIALRQDHSLRERYRSDAVAAVASFPGLTEHERRLLATRHAGAIQLAAKGKATSPVNQDLLARLFRDRHLASRLLRALRERRGDVAARASHAGIEADWDCLRAGIEGMLRTSLSPWTGLYQVQSGEPFLIAILADGGSTHLVVDGVAVRAARYRQGVLTWRSGPGQPFHGMLRPDVDASGRRRLIGVVWCELSSKRDVVAVEGDPGRRHAAAHIGELRSASGEGLLSIGVEGDEIAAALDGAHLPGPVSVDRTTLRAGGRSFSFDDWHPVNALPRDLAAMYRATAAGGRAFTLHIASSGVRCDGVLLPQARLTRHGVSWAEGPPDFEHGDITCVLDPVSLDSVMFGRIGAGNGTGTKCSGVAHRSLPRATGELGLRGRAWRQAVDLARTRQGLLLWHRWEKASFASNLVQALLASELP